MSDIKQIGSLFKEYQIKQVDKNIRRTERGDLIDFFREKINASRKRDGFKEYPKSSIAWFLSPFKTGDLYSLRIKCQEAKDFSRMFWYYVKPKK